MSIATADRDPIEHGDRSSDNNHEWERIEAEVTVMRGELERTKAERDDLRGKLCDVSAELGRTQAREEHYRALVDSVAKYDADIALILAGVRRDAALRGIRAIIWACRDAAGG